MNRDHISLKLPREEGESDEREEEFTMYVMDLSYFSGKLECYFNYQGLKWGREEPSWVELGKLKHQAGTSQVPLVRDNIEGAWLRDTTSIIHHLEAKYPDKAPSTLTGDPVADFFSLLLEDWADEYLWRPAMYYRWEPTFDSGQLSQRFSWEFLDRVTPFHLIHSALAPLDACLPKSISIEVVRHRQWLFSVFGEGIVSEEQHRAVQSQYLRSLAACQKIFSSQPFLLGNRPTRADFGLMAPFFRHFSSDPTPRKIMQQRAPAVFEWVARMWNCRRSTLPASTFKPDNPIVSLPKGWEALQPLFKEYLVYLDCNARAWSRGESQFTARFQGVESQVQTVPYRVWCRLELQRRVEDVEGEAKERLEQALKAAELWDPLWSAGKVEIAPEQGISPPHCNSSPKTDPPDSPKWPLEPLIFRYVCARMPRIILVLACLFCPLLALYLGMSPT